VFVSVSVYYVLTLQQQSKRYTHKHNAITISSKVEGKEEKGGKKERRVSNYINQESNNSTPTKEQAKHF